MSVIKAIGTVTAYSKPKSLTDGAALEAIIAILNLIIVAMIFLAVPCHAIVKASLNR